MRDIRFALAAVLLCPALAAAQQQGDPYRTQDYRRDNYDYSSSRDRYDQRSRVDQRTSDWYDRDGYDTRDSRSRQPTSQQTFTDRDRQRFEQAQREADQRFQQAVSDVKSESRTIRGRIESVDRMNHGTFNTVRINVQQDDGRRTSIFLGPAAEVADMDLREGRQLEATGYQTQISGVDAFMASRLQVGDDQRTFIQRREKPQRITGRVTDAWTAYVQREGTTNRIIEVQSDQGQRVVVDLGPADAVDLRLSENQPVEVRGLQSEVNGRPIILADQIRVRSATTLSGNPVNQDQDTEEASSIEDEFKDFGRRIRDIFKD